jgi:hypothetical protein
MEPGKRGEVGLWAQVEAVVPLRQKSRMEQFNLEGKEV